MTTWTNHVVNLLKRCNLIPRTHVAKWSQPKKKSRPYLRLNINGWRLDRASPLIRQNNSHDCGPLACLKLMDIFGTLKKTSISSSTREIRELVISEYKRLLEKTMSKLELKEKKDLKQQSGIILPEEVKQAKTIINIPSDTPSNGDIPVDFIDIQGGDDTTKNSIPGNLSALTVYPSSAIKSPSPFRRSIQIPQDILQAFCSPIEEEKTVSTNATGLLTVSSMRITALGRKRKRQDNQAIAMMRTRGNVIGKAIVGDIVAIKVDIRDVSHPQGILGCVCQTTTKGSGGVMVATTAGILCHGDTKNFYGYRVRSTGY